MNNKFFPSNFLFVTIMFMGSVLSLSSSHWLSMWMGLELNLMGFLPLMNIKGKMLEAEASMKYFIIQSLSSSVLILSSIMLYYYNLSWYSMFMNNSIMIFIILSLVLKLGGAPMHFWLPSITKKMTWIILFMLLTWQKLAPLLMLSLFNSGLHIILITSILSTLMGSLMALNQTNLQLILTYSSISHLGWMMSIISINSTLSMIYFINYILISIPLLNIISNSIGDHLFMLTQKSNKNNIIIMTLIMSLAGLPPMLGFMSKLIVIILLMDMYMIILSLTLFIGTLISLYFYLNMCLMVIIKSYMMLITPKHNKMYNSIISMNVFSVMIVYPILIMIIKYAMTILYKPQS
uniref:NADH-ubiquinone oxidoreductase chain 2 n=2 Tax=Pterygioteuthis giardi TaxID=559548 RepID=D2K892_PTEGA|nr:NADH dehydrogenase subunit 2 [Pterygioteuthis giardi]